MPRYETNSSTSRKSSSRDLPLPARKSEGQFPVARTTVRELKWTHTRGFASICVVSFVVVGAPLLPTCVRLSLRRVESVELANSRIAGFSPFSCFSAMMGVVAGYRREKGM